jgi:flagellar protein FlaG
MSIPSVTLPAQASTPQYDVAGSSKDSKVQSVASDKSVVNDKSSDKLAPSDKQALKDQFSPEELKKAADKVNAVVNLYASELKFTVDDKEGVVVKVINTDTKEVIRQIPTEEMIKIAESIDKLRGLLVHQKV